MKLLLKLRFDGTLYHGFQAQADGRAIQNILTDSFSDLLQFPVSVTGCSRTDSGVHARGFCATVAPRNTEHTENWCPIPAEKFHRAANACLPDDISVCGAAWVPDDFHPRYNAIGKAYEYHIYNAPARDPFLHGRAYHLPRPLSDHDLHIMNEVAAAFVGEHDFAGYMATGSKITDTVRNVRSASLKRNADGLLVFRIEANGFLYNMVRIMTGTLLECAVKSRTLSDAREALLTGDRTKAGFTAPPHGLYLAEVTYDRDIVFLAE